MNNERQYDYPSQRQHALGLQKRDGVKRWADNNEPVDARPRCAVRGILRHGTTAICGHVIVGGEFCGHDLECQHKVPNAEITGG